MKDPHFKVLEHVVLSKVNASFAAGQKKPDQEAADPAVLAQYKELIREQDCRINDISRANIYLQQELQTSQAKIEEMTQQINSLLDQNQLLKAQTSGIDIRYKQNTAL